MTAELAIGWGLALLAGAMIGSFLTVVAARVPPLVFDSPNGRVRLGRLFRTLSWPGSHCTGCNTPLRWRDNIPLVSFLLLRGRSRCCDASYGSRYVLLEIATAAAALASVMLFGWSAQTVLVFALLAVLLALCAIDLAEMLLPDVLVLPLLPLGLLYQTLYGAGLAQAVLGAAAGFAVLWSIGALYRQSRQRDGLGGGDVKLAGALGAWLGISAIPAFLLLAFAAGLVGMGLPMLLRKTSADAPVPFGPFLALSAGLFVLLPYLPGYLAALLAG